MINQGVTVRFFVAAVVVLVLFAGVTPSGASAANGTFTQHLCFNADTGRGTGAPPEITVTQAQQGYEYSTSCTGEIGPDKGLLFSSGLPTHTADHQVAELTYSPSSGVRLLGGNLFRYWRAPALHPAHQVLRVHGGPTGRSFGPYVAEYVSWWEAEIGLYPWGDRGLASFPFSTQNAVPLSVGPFGIWRVALWCDSAGAGGCDLPAGSSAYRIFGARLTLQDDYAPAIKGLVGELASASTVRGKADLAISATDVGAGVYRARLTVDGVPTTVVSAEGNKGECLDVNPSNSDPYEFGTAAPCRPAASFELSVDTGRWKNGEHSIAVVVEDASGNSVTALSRRVLTINSNGTGIGQLAFSVGRRTIKNGQVLRYTGRAIGTDGSRPYVDVQVRSGRRWRPVCAARTRQSGRFSCRYRFARTFSKTRYVFRARVRAQPATGERTVLSRTRAVVVTP